MLSRVSGQVMGGGSHLLQRPGHWFLYCLIIPAYFFRRQVSVMRYFTWLVFPCGFLISDSNKSKQFRPIERRPDQYRKHATITTTAD
jgi:hypothetical protein